MRLHAETATIENGFVWLPQEALWLADYLAEFAALPRGRHDDQVELDRPGPRLDQAQAGGAGDERLLAGAGDGGLGGATRAPFSRSGEGPGMRAQAGGLAAAAAHKGKRRRLALRDTPGSSQFKPG